MSAIAPAAPESAAEPLAPAAQRRPVAHCENCGTPVPERFCGTCGQRLEPPVHSLWHFGRIAVEDLTHADSRLWRTLGALLLKPGYLTAEFLAGRRVRYLPPVRLYLVVSLLFFFWAAATQPRPYALEIHTNSRSGAVVPLDEAVGHVAGRAPTGETSEARAERFCSKMTYEGPWAARMTPLAKGACLKITADEGRSFQEAFQHNLPRAMFIFLPLLAATMLLMYWRPRRYYVEHLLLLVHYHAFVFVLVVLAWALATLMPLVGPWIRLAVVLYIPWCLYRAMRVVYGQGPWLTAGKAGLLALAYLMSGLLMLTANMLYSALTL